MAVSYRYYRLRGISGIPDYFEISEWQIVSSGTRLVQTTQASSINPDAGILSDLVDGGVGSRCYWTAAHATDASFWAKLDFGSPTNATGFKLGGYTNSDRYPTACIVEGSNDNSTWIELANVTGLTYPGNFTLSAEMPLTAPGLYANQGTLTVTGLTPSLSLGFAAAPTQGTLTITGQTPKHSSTTFLGTPVQGVLAVSGLQPAMALGFAAAVVQGSMSIIGEQPSIGIGFADMPGQGTLTITGQTPKHSSTTFMGTPGQGALAITGLQPSIALGFAATPAIRQLTVTGLVPGFANRLLHPITSHWISTHYLCTLTGFADSLPDIELPISSFQTRMGADPFRVYLSVIVPGVDSYIAAINARPNGRLKVTRVYNYLDGSFQSFTMAEAPFDTLSTNQGGKSGTTGTLNGYETLVAATAQSVTLYDPITRSSNAGGRRYRCRIDPRLRPLDTAVINGESFVVDNVLHIIDTQTAIMEISEKL